MARHILFFVLVVVFIAALFNTTFVVNYFAPRIIESRVEGIKVEAFHAAGQRFEFPNKIRFRDIQLKFSYREIPFQCSSREAVLYQLVSLLDSKSKSKIEFKGLDIKTPMGNVKGLNLRLRLALRVKSLGRINAVMNDGTVSLEDNDFSNVSAQIRGTRDKIVLSELEGSAFGGNFQGQVSLEFSPDFSYVVWLEAYGMQPKELESIHEETFSQIEGKVNGSLRIVGRFNYVDILAANFSLANGGKIKRSLGERVSRYITDDDTRAFLLEYFRNEESLPVDTASVQVQNVDHVGITKGTVYFTIVNSDFRLRLKEIVKLDIDKILRNLLPKNN